MSVELKSQIVIYVKIAQWGWGDGGVFMDFLVDSD